MCIFNWICIAKSLQVKSRLQNELAKTRIRCAVLKNYNIFYVSAGTSQKFCLCAQHIRNLTTWNHDHATQFKALNGTTENIFNYSYSSNLSESRWFYVFAKCSFNYGGIVIYVIAHSPTVVSQMALFLPVLSSFLDFSSFFRLFPLSLTGFVATKKYTSALANSVWSFSIYSSSIAISFCSSLNWTITVDFNLKAVKTCTTYRTHTFLQFGQKIFERASRRSGRQEWRSCYNYTLQLTMKYRIYRLKNCNDAISKNQPRLIQIFKKWSHTEQDKHDVVCCCRVIMCGFLRLWIFSLNL